MIRISALAAAFFFLPYFGTGAAVGGEGETDGNLVAITIQLYSQTLSRADGDRCVMYPSCTVYAQKAVSRFGWIKGWIMTCDRLIRCGRDETRRVTPVIVNGRRRFPDPVPEKWGHDTPFGTYEWPSQVSVTP